MLRRVFGGRAPPKSAALRKAELKKQMAELELEIAELEARPPGEVVEDEDPESGAAAQGGHGAEIELEADGEPQRVLDEYVPTEAERRRYAFADEEPGYTALVQASTPEPLSTRYPTTVYCGGVLFAFSLLIFLTWFSLDADRNFFKANPFAEIAGQRPQYRPRLRPGESDDGDPPWGAGPSLTGHSGRMRKRV